MSGLDGFGRVEPRPSRLRAVRVVGTANREQAPGYVFYVPGRQGAGQLLDYSDASLTGLRKSGLTEAQQFAVAGYVSSVAGTDAYSYITSPGVAVDWTEEVLVFSTRVRMPAPAANASIMGTGGNPAPHGFYLSARTSGKVLIGVSSTAGFYNSGEIGPTVFDDTEHAVGVVIDGPNNQIWVYVDGGLIFTATGLGLAGLSNAPVAFALGSAFFSVSSLASALTRVREIHYIKPPSLPLNVDEIMLRLATTSGLLTAAEMDLG